MAGESLPGKEYSYAEDEDEQGRRQTVQGHRIRKDPSKQGVHLAYFDEKIKQT